MNREQWRDYQDKFLGEMAVLHVTCNTDLTAIAGPIDLFQIQIDTTQSDTATSLEFADSNTGPVFKRACLSTVGTREVTFLGRPLRVTENLYITRPDADVHIVHMSILYRPVV
jgi:hypothetical protein